MQQLSGKIVGDSFPPNQWNQLPQEIQNLIETSGLSLSGGDLEQGKKSLLQYIVSGRFGVDSGTVNNYVLSMPIPSYVTPPDLKDERKIFFLTSNANTGAATLSAYGLGTKLLVDEGGAALLGGEISSTEINVAYYNESSDHWRLFSSPIALATESIEGGLQIATQSEVNEGLIDNKYVTSLTLENAIIGSSNEKFSYKTTDTAKTDNSLTADPHLNGIILDTETCYQFEAFL